MIALCPLDEELARSRILCGSSVGRIGVDDSGGSGGPFASLQLSSDDRRIEALP
jgi:hypothetical protein